MPRKKLPYMPVYVDELGSHQLLSVSPAAFRFYFIVRSLMWASPRRGYLLSTRSLPLATSDEAFACHLEVNEAVSLRLELIAKGLFEVSKDGAIYDPIMVRREEISAKRSAAGKASAAKGGVCSTNLFNNLSDNLSNNHMCINTSGCSPGGEKPIPPEGGSAQTPPAGAEKSHGGEPAPGVGGPGGGVCSTNLFNKTPPPDFDLTPQGLAQKWVFLLRRTPQIDELAEAVKIIGELIRCGKITADKIDADLDRTLRNRSEYLWELRKRLECKGINGAAKLTLDEEIYANGQRFIDRGRKNGSH